MTTATAEFTQLRPLLFSVAYRMLGTASDVDDVLQEAWLRYSAAAGVRDARAYLVRVVTRLCLDLLGSARVRRERYVGPWLPEPVLTGAAAGGGAPGSALAGGPAGTVDPVAVVERRELLSLGAVALLERLSPAERAVVVLREGLDYSHQEVAAAVGVSVEASRQLLSRARQRLAGGPVRRDADPEQHRRLLAALLEAFGAGDTATLVDLLRADVMVLSDGGGRVRAALRPIEGRDKVARFLAGIWPDLPADAELGVVEINGAPGLVAVRAGRLLFAAALQVRDGAVAQVMIMTSPGKLGYLAAQLGHGTAVPGDYAAPGRRRDSP